MFPPTRKPPKRIGGAPFTAAPMARRGPPRQPHSARAASTTKCERADAKLSSDMPLSARGYSSGPVATASDRGDGTVTPCTRRAQQYYNQLLGKVSQGADTRQDWALVQEVDALDFFNREETQRRVDREKQMRNQADLKDQMQKHNLVAEKCRDVWKQWRSELEEDVVAYNREEEVKRAFTMETQRRFDQERRKQLEETQRRKALQREQEKMLERDMMHQAELAKRRQDEADQQRKEKQRQAALYMRTQAEKEHERKLQAKLEEHENDRRMCQRHQELLDEQERNRGKYFQEIRDKQAKLLESYEVGVGNELARLQAKDDERARRQAEEREEKQRQDHQDRERWRQQLAQSGRLAVEQQLANKDRERQRLKEEEQRFVAKQRREAAMAEAREAENSQKKKEALMQNAEFVRKQIKEKEDGAAIRKVEAAQMDDNEKLFNRDKLQRVNNPHGYQQLIERKRAEYRRNPQAPCVAMPC